MVADVCYVYYFWPSPLLRSNFGVSLIILSFFIPIFILVYCYGRIAWVLTRRIESKLNFTGPNVDTFYLARTNTIKTFLTVALCFVIYWSSSQIYYLMYNLGYEADFNGMFFNFTVLMTFVNCTVNPFIYLIKYRDFQDALRHCCIFSKSDSHYLSSNIISKPSDLWPKLLFCHSQYCDPFCQS